MKSVLTLNKILKYGARLLQHLVVRIPKDIFCGSFLFHIDALSSGTPSSIWFDSSPIIHTEILHFIYCFLTHSLPISYSSMLNDLNNPSTVIYSSRTVEMEFCYIVVVVQFWSFLLPQWALDDGKYKQNKFWFYPGHLLHFSYIYWERSESVNDLVIKALKGINCNCTNDIRHSLRRYL
jgi:hypothetical protein